MRNDMMPISLVFEQLIGHFVTQYGNPADHMSQHHPQVSPVHYKNLYLLTGEKGIYLAGCGQSLVREYNLAIQIVRGELDDAVKLFHTSAIKRSPTLFFAKSDGTFFINRRHEVGEKVIAQLGPDMIRYFTVCKMPISTGVYETDRQGQRTEIIQKQLFYRTDLPEYLAQLIEVSYGPYKSDPEDDSLFQPLLTSQ